MHCDLMVPGKNLLQLDKVKNALMEICADWYSLAIQLDIDCKTRKVQCIYTPMLQS